MHQQLLTLLTARLRARIRLVGLEHLLSLVVVLLLFVAGYQWLELFSSQQVVYSGNERASVIGQNDKTSTAELPTLWKYTISRDEKPGSTGAIRERLGILQQEIAEKDVEVLKLTGENKLLRQELKDIKQDCEVKLKRLTDEKTLILHKLAHLSVKGRP